MPSDFRKPRLEGGHEKLRRFDRSSLARHTNAVSPPSRVRAVWSSPAIEDEHTMKLRLVGLVWACSWSCLILAAGCGSSTAPLDSAAGAAAAGMSASAGAPTNATAKQAPALACAAPTKSAQRWPKRACPAQEQRAGAPSSAHPTTARANP